MAEEFDAERWLKRFVEAGGHLQLDVATMTPREDVPKTPESLAIGAEITGPENEAEFYAVEALVERLTGAGPKPRAGLTYYPQMYRLIGRHLSGYAALEKIGTGFLESLLETKRK